MSRKKLNLKLTFEQHSIFILDRTWNRSWNVLKWKAHLTTQFPKKKILWKSLNGMRLLNGVKWDFVISVWGYRSCMFLITLLKPNQNWDFSHFFFILISSHMRPRPFLLQRYVFIPLRLVLMHSFQSCPDEFFEQYKCHSYLTEMLSVVLWSLADVICCPLHISLLKLR